MAINPLISSSNAVQNELKTWVGADSAKWSITGNFLTNKLLKDGDSALLHSSCTECTRIDFKCSLTHDGKMQFFVDGKLKDEFGDFDCKSSYNSYILAKGSHSFKWRTIALHGDHQGIIQFTNLKILNQAESALNQETLFEDSYLPTDLKTNLVISNTSPFQGNYSLNKGFFKDGEEQFVEIPVDGMTRAEFYLGDFYNQNMKIYIDDQSYDFGSWWHGWNKVVVHFPLGSKKLKLSNITANGDQFSSINMDNLRTQKQISTAGDSVDFEDGLVEWAQQKNWFQNNSSPFQGDMALQSRVISQGETLSLTLPEKEFSKFQVWITNGGSIKSALWVDGVLDTTNKNPYSTSYVEYNIQRPLAKHKIELKAWSTYHGSYRVAIDQLRWSK